MFLYQSGGFVGDSVAYSYWKMLLLVMANIGMGVAEAVSVVKVPETIDWGVREKSSFIKLKSSTK